MISSIARYLTIAPTTRIATSTLRPTSFLLLRSVGGGPQRPRFPENRKRSPRRRHDDDDNDGSVAVFKDNRMFRSSGGRQRNPEYQRRNRKNHYDAPEDEYRSSGDAAVWKDNRLFRSTRSQRRQNPVHQQRNVRDHYVPKDEFGPYDNASSAQRDDMSIRSTEENLRRRHPRHHQRSRTDDEDEYGPSDGYSSNSRQRHPRHHQKSTRNDEDVYGPSDGYASAVKKRRGKPKPGQLLKTYLRRPLESLPKNIMSSVPNIKNYILKDWFRLHPGGAHLRKLQRDIAFRMDNSPGKLDREHLLPIVAALENEGAVQLDTIRDSQGTVSIRPPVENEN